MGVGGGLGPRALGHQYAGELQVEGPSAEHDPTRQVGAGEPPQDDQADRGGDEDTKSVSFADAGLAAPSPSPPGLLADTEWLDDAGVPANTRCEGAATALTTDSGALQRVKSAPASLHKMIKRIAEGDEDTKSVSFADAGLAAPSPSPPGLLPRAETGRLRQQLVAVTEEHDALLGRQQTSDAVISKLQDREDRAARLENSVELRRELGDVAEAALTTARDRILALEADLAASLLRINHLEEGDDLRHTSLLAQSDEAAAEAAAAHAESSADTEWLDDAGVPANTRCEGAATVLTTDSGALQPAVTSRGEATAIGLGPPGAATGGRLGATGVTTEWLDDVGVSDQGGPANQTSTSTSAPAWVNAFADVTLELVDASLGRRWDCPTQNPPADLCRWFCAGCVLMATNCFTCCVRCLE